MVVELRQMHGTHMATGKRVVVPQYQIMMDGQHVGYLSWKPLAKVMLIRKVGPVEREELERLVREQVPSAVTTATVPDVPQEMLEENRGATYDDFDT